MKKLTTILLLAIGLTSSASAHHMEQSGTARVNILDTSLKTNSTHYSPTSTNEASWLSAVFKYDSSIQSMVPANITAGPSATSNSNKIFLWSGNLFSDIFS